MIIRTYQNNSNFEPSMNNLLNAISVAAAFVFGVGVIYFALDYTVGRLKFLRSKFEWYGLQVKDFAFLIVAASLLLMLVSFYMPY